MADGTALEIRDLVVPGDRSSRRGASSCARRPPPRPSPPRSRSTWSTCGARRSNRPRAAGRAGCTWRSSGAPPPTELAAAGDPYTLPVTSRGAGPARRFVRLVERHVRERGLPVAIDPVGGSSGVVLTADAPSRPPRPETPDPDEDLVARLKELAELHAAGALSDEEFQRAKDRLLG